MEFLLKYWKFILGLVAAAIILGLVLLIWNLGGDSPGYDGDYIAEEVVAAPVEIPAPPPAPPEIPTPADDRQNRPLRTYFPHIHDENFAALMPVFDHLSDPFEFFAYSVGASAEILAAYGIPADGRVATPEHWELRRAEIRDLLMYYYFGYMWPTSAENVTVNTAARPASDGEINITVNETRLDGTPVSATGVIAFGVWLPSFEQLAENGFWCLEENSGTGGPLVIANFHFFTDEQIAGFLERGIGVASAFNTPGFGEDRDGLYFDLFPFNRGVTEYNTGTLMATAWTISRIIDAFELNSDWGVNANAIASLGNSFAGKRALFAGIMDERVALTIPHESGGDGGVAPFRHSHAGRIHYYNADALSRVHSRHETSRTGNASRGAAAVASFFRTPAPYEESIFLLPFDMHLAIALTAPTAANPNRAFLSLETDNFGTWTGWSAARTANAAAAEVFNFLGNDNIAFRQRSSGHMIQDSDYPVIWAALDFLFGQPVHDTETGFRGGREENQIYVEDVFGVALPGVWENFSALSRSPIEVDSAWFPWSRPGVHKIWTDTQIIGAGLPAEITAFTDAPFVELILWSHGDGNRLSPTAPRELGHWSADVTDGVAIFELSADEVKVGRFELAARSVGRDGERLAERSVFFHAIDAHTALRHGTTRDNVGGAGNSTIIGFTSRVNPETLRAYLRDAYGEETAVIPTRHQTNGHWLMPYGVRLGAIPGTGNERAYILRGLQFEAMTGFTFELSLQENLHTEGQPAAIWAASEAAQIVTPYPHWRAGGTGLRPSPWIPPAENRRSDFNIGVAVSAPDHPNMKFWQIDFTAPVNPRDFGIGFNFSENFWLYWREGYTRLAVEFFDYDPRRDGERVMYIFRARAYGSNDDFAVINTPIRYSIRQ